MKSLLKSENAILGVIRSKFLELGDSEEMPRKGYKAADIVAEGNNETSEEALKRLGVSPRSGLASHSSGNALGRDDMAAKLKLVRQLTDSIWSGEL